MNDEPPASTWSLIGEASLQARSLFAKELSLLRHETDGNIEALITVVSRFGAALVLILAALFLAVLALVKAVAALVGSEALGALIVGAPFTIAAVALAYAGLRRMARSNLLPNQTARQLGRDIAVVTRSDG